MEVRDGAIWGNVKWTAKASAAIADLEYRFISPAFLHTKDDEARILCLTSAGLVHRPNFDMPALNNQQDPVMDKELLKALGLAETADTATAIAAVNALQTPSPTKYVPRADYDQVLARAANAEARIAETEKVQAQAAAEQLVDKGIGDGKIAPASRDHYLKLALNSRADVEALLSTAPAILKTGADDKLANADPAKGAGTLTDAQKAMCAQMDISEEQFLKALA
jgi:phage I-like protein